MLKAIHAQEDKESAREKAKLVAEKLRKMNLNKVAEFVESTVEETLSYMDFPYEHWTRLRTNNALERIMKEIRRRTRVIGAFPDGVVSKLLRTFDSECSEFRGCFWRSRANRLTIKLRWSRSVCEAQPSFFYFTSSL